MGLKPKEVAGLTLPQFNLMLGGYHKRQELENNRTRQIMTFIINYGGMGTKEYLPAESVWPLHIDKENIKRMITTMHQAKELLKEFEPF